jgi:hypothetical protein
LHDHPEWAAELRRCARLKSGRSAVRPRPWLVILAFGGLVGLAVISVQIVLKPR